MKNINYKIYILLFVIMLVLIIIYGITSINEKVLIDESKSIVFTSYKEENNEKEIPNFNIRKISDNLNQEINKFLEPFLYKETNRISYKYQVNGNILSFILIVEDYSKEGPADTSFLSYVIDLKELKVLSRDEILELFNYNESMIVDTLNKYFKEAYNNEISYGVINNISYEEYLKIHEITNFTDQIHYYINENQKLNVYFDYKEWAAEKETQDFFIEQGYIFDID